MQKITEGQYAIEATKIVSGFETWTKLWAEALEKAEKGDMKDTDSLRTDFRNGEYGAARRLDLLHSYMMGEGPLAGPAGGFLKVMEAGLFSRLETDEFFTIQHYYDSLQVMLSKMIRVQLMGLHFRICAEEKPSEASIAKWSDEVQANFKAQKARVIDCMPLFIRKIKPNFESGPVTSNEHWWRFIEEEQRGKCLAVREADAWWTAIDVKSGGQKYNLVGSSGCDAKAWHEWRWERPLLVDRTPNPETPRERFPLADRKHFDKACELQQKEHMADLTYVISRHSHCRLWAKTGITAKGPLTYDPNDKASLGQYDEWYSILFKIVPVKGRNVPAFKLQAMYPTRDFHELNADSWSISKDTVYYLEDEGTMQDSEVVAGWLKQAAALLPSIITGLFPKTG